MRVATQIELTNEELSELTALVRSKLTSVRLALRARIVLLAAQGLQNMDIAAQVGVGRVQVSRWRGRYAESRLAGIESDLPRGAPPVRVDVARLVELTTESKPKASTHWSTRTMATELGISAASVSRHWRAKGLKPHLVRSFKSRAIRSSSRSLKTSWACTFRRPSMRLFCVAMKKVRYKHWIAHNRAYR